MRKAGIWLLTLVFYFSCVAPALAADDGSVYRFTLSAAQAPGATIVNTVPEDTLDVSLDLSRESSGGGESGDGVSLYAVSYVLKYNASVLEMDQDGVAYDQHNSEKYICSVKDDAKWEGWKDLTLNIVVSDMAGSRRTNPSNLLRLKFTVKKVGMTTLFCSSAQMSDVTGARLNTAKNDLQIVCSGSSSIETPEIPIDDPPVVPGSLPFTDVAEGVWYYDAVGYVYQEKVMNGVSETLFEPETELTRSMMVQILYNLEGRPSAERSAGFSDVRSGDWFGDAVYWAADAGIVLGYPDGSFAPAARITREQTAAILFRYAGYKGQDVSARGDLSGYRDLEDVSGYAMDAMAWANARSIIRGVTSDTLAPKGTATRAQIAQMMMNYRKDSGS